MDGLRMAFWWLLVGTWTLFVAAVYSHDKDSGEVLACCTGAIIVLMTLSYMAVQFIGG